MPAYGAGRTTYDLDIAVECKTQLQLDQLLEKLQTQNVRTAQKPKASHLVFAIFEPAIKDEAEIWLQPCSGFPWDDEIISRIISLKMDPFAHQIKVLSPEDFILTKLGREDRSISDLQDVVQIILAQESLDWEYLFRRANQFDLENILSQLVKRVQEILPDFKIPSK